MIQRDPRRAIGQFLYFGLIGLMLLVTAPKTIRAIQVTLPEADKFQSYAALAAIDGGLLIWLFLFKHNADSTWRRGVALIMTVITLVATLGLTAMDSFLEAGHKGATAVQASDLTALSVWLVVAIIGLNILAGVLWEVNPGEWVSERPGQSLPTGHNPQDLEVYKITSKPQSSLPSNGPASRQEQAPRIVQAERVDQLDQQTSNALEQARVIEPVKTRKLPAGKVAKKKTAEMSPEEAKKIADTIKRITGMK